MPEISRFFGIIVTLYFSDHPPPHFHVTYGAQSATFDIETLRLLEGRLSPRVRGLVIEGASQHQDERRANGLRARGKLPLSPIQPLQ